MQQGEEAASILARGVHRSLVYPMSFVTDYLLHVYWKRKQETIAPSFSPAFSACLVYYLAVVYLVPSGPDHTHSVANWVLVSAGRGPTDDGKYGGPLIWSAPGGWPERGDQLGCRLPLICVELNF